MALLLSGHYKNDNGECKKKISNTDNNKKNNNVANIIMPHAQIHCSTL